MNIYSVIQIIAVVALPLIFAITLHEAAHGWVANKCGDSTALMLGRVTANPLKHIDPIGTVLLPLAMIIFSKVMNTPPFIFGWAKPVPVSWQNLRNPRRDMAIVAFAGPAANFVMALAWGLIAKLSLMFLPDGGMTQPIIKDTASFLHVTSIYGIIINIFLMVLNLIPIPPLDGSRIVTSILPPAAAISYNKIEPYGIWILLALLFTRVLLFIIIPPVRFLIAFIKGLFGINTGLF